jgi:hypothetical protein
MGCPTPPGQVTSGLNGPFSAGAWPFIRRPTLRIGRARFRLDNIWSIGAPEAPIGTRKHRWFNEKSRGCGFDLEPELCALAAMQVKPSSPG